MTELTLKSSENTPSISFFILNNFWLDEENEFSNKNKFSKSLLTALEGADLHVVIVCIVVVVVLKLQTFSSDLKLHKQENSYKHCSSS